MDDTHMAVSGSGSQIYDLQHLDRHYLATALCSYSQCFNLDVDSIVTQTESGRPCFDSYVEVICSVGCLFYFHDVCWALQKSQSNIASDQDCLQVCCLTSECYGQVATVKIVDSNSGSVISSVSAFSVSTTTPSYPDQSTNNSPQLIATQSAINMRNANDNTSEDSTDNSLLPDLNEMYVLPRTKELPIRNERKSKGKRKQAVKTAREPNHTTCEQKTGLYYFQNYLKQFRDPSVYILKTIVDRDEVYVTPDGEVTGFVYDYLCRQLTDTGPLYVLDKTPDELVARITPNSDMKFSTIDSFLVFCLRCPQVYYVCGYLCVEQDLSTAHALLLSVFVSAFQSRASGMQQKSVPISAQHNSDSLKRISSNQISDNTLLFSEKCLCDAVAETNVQRLERRCRDYESQLQTLKRHLAERYEQEATLERKCATFLTKIDSLQKEKHTLTEKLSKQIFDLSRKSDVHSDDFLLSTLSPSTSLGSHTAVLRDLSGANFQLEEERIAYRRLVDRSLGSAQSHTSQLNDINTERCDELVTLCNFLMVQLSMGRFGGNKLNCNKKIENLKSISQSLQAERTRFQETISACEQQLTCTQDITRALDTVDSVRLPALSSVQTLLDICTCNSGNNSRNCTGRSSRDETSATPFSDSTDTSLAGPSMHAATPGVAGSSHSDSALTGSMGALSDNSTLNNIVGTNGCDKSALDLLCDEIAACMGEPKVARMRIMLQLAELRRRSGDTFSQQPRSVIVQTVADLIRNKSTKRMTSDQCAHTSSLDNESSFYCAICLDYFSQHQAETVSCGHTLHTLCFARWKRQNPHSDVTCPLCRCVLMPEPFPPLS